MPANSLWKAVTGPSAALVQQHFVEARVNELKRRNPELEALVAKVLMEHPLLKHLKLKGDGWLEVYRKINKNLQAADLTINFKAESWFTTENHYPSYTQAYERSSSEGRRMLKGDRQNPADVRARVDDAVTIPKAWNAPAAPAQRGLRPGLQSGQRIGAQMQFGAQKRIEKPGAAGFGGQQDEAPQLVGVESRNKHFNPKTKQVFAALNYGRRPHGSSMEYGDCFLVLHPRLKVNALYFGGDTFALDALKKLDQTPFGMLGALVAHARPRMVSDIIASGYNDRALADVPVLDSPEFLLEAHIFSELPFDGNLQEVCLPLRYRATAIGTHANTFAKKHGAKLRWVM